MLALSKLTYSITNTTMPDNIVKQIKQIVFSFLWNGPTDRVKRSIICNDYASGGLRMINIDAFVNSINATWVSKYVYTQNDYWAVLMQSSLNHFGKNVLLQTNFDHQELFPQIEELPKVYQNIIISFNNKIKIF